MKKISHRLLSVLLLIVFICTACGKTETINNNNTTSDNNTDKNNSTQNISDKDIEIVRKEFTKFTDRIFFETLEESVLTVHSILDYPENMGITNYKYTLGDFSKENNEQYLEQLKGYIKELKSFDYELLDSNQQLLYDILLIDFEDSIELESYYLFDTNLSSLNGIPSSIPSYLGQYSFNTVIDVTDYLKILELIPEYYTSMMEYEQYKCEQGIYTPDFQLDNVIDQCNEFIADKDNHYLITTFNEKISSLTILNEEEKQTYISQNEDIIKNKLIPAYNKLITDITSLKGKCTVDGGLCQYKNGKDYYEILVKTSTNSNKSIEEIKTMLNNQLEKDLEQYLSIFYKDENIVNEIENYSIDTSTPDAILQHLINSIKEDFPENKETNYELMDVPKALEKHQSPAYYYIPAMDNPSDNKIFINKYEEYATMDMVSLLAHEGFPGHMYQCTYFNNSSPDKLRSLLFYSGYLEGWGLYSELYSYELAGMEDNIASFNRLNSCIAYDIYCLADIGINYEGWNLEDTAEFIVDLGYPKESAKEVYEALIEDPCSYLTYYVGYLEIMEMKNTAKKELGDSFTEKSFHKFILDIGPAPFEIINDRFGEWINKQKNKL